MHLKLSYSPNLIVKLSNLLNLLNLLNLDGGRLAPLLPEDCYTHTPASQTQNLTNLANLTNLINLKLNCSPNLILNSAAGGQFNKFNKFEIKLQP